MCILATGNLAICFKLYVLSPRSVSKGTLSPTWKLTVIFTFVCAYRSYFPTIYLSRSCFVESGVSGILLARLMAFVGELCWMVQVANSLKVVNRALSRSPAVNVLANFVVVLISAAECFSTYATVTKNSLFFTLEEGSWVVAGVTCITPALFILVRAYRRVEDPSRRDPMIRLYLTIFVGFMFVYDIWGVSTDVRSNWNRYIEERDEVPSPWLDFHTGLDQVTGLCNLDRSWETWSGYLLWMTGYFSLGVWSSLALSILVLPEKSASAAPSEPLLV